MKLEEAIVLSGATTIIKIAVVLAATKYISSALGSEGFLVLGSYQNWLGIFTGLATAGMMTGVVKYVSAAPSSEKSSYISSAVLIMLCMSPIACLAIYLLPKNISVIFGISGLFNLLFFVAISSSSLTLLFNSLANANGDNRRFMVVSTGAATSIYAGASLGVFLNGSEGMIAGLFVSSIFTLILGIRVYYPTKWFYFEAFRPRKNINAIRKLLAFGGVALISMITIPAGKIIVRSIQSESFSLDYAGQWDALILISTSYMAPLYGILGFYFLPRYSKANDFLTVNALLVSGIKKMGVVLLLGLLVIYSFKDYWIAFMLGNEFELFELFLPYMLVSDIFRFLAMFVAYLMLAKNHLKIFAILEIVFTLIYPVSLYIFIQYFGQYAAGISYLFISVSYFLTLYIWYFNKFKYSFSEV